MGIQNIYETLNEISLCDSAYDFSTDYLGKSKSYYSVLKAKDKEASIDSILMLEQVIRDRIEIYSKYDYEVFKQKKNKLLLLIKQASQLHKEYECAIKGIKINEEDD